MRDFSGYQIKINQRYENDKKRHAFHFLDHITN